MFVAALVVIAKKWKPKCPLTEEWINKIWHVLVGHKRNEELIHATSWIDHENISLTKKKSVTEEHISYDFTYMKCSE